MKINQETGEVVESTEIVDVHNQEIAKMISEDILNIYAQFEMYKQQKEMFEHSLMEEMKKRNIIKYEDDYIRINYVQPHTSTRVDTEKLKNDGLYDEYSKQSMTKESVRITIKND